MVPAASSVRAIASGDPNRFMSPSNRHVAKFLQRLFLWSYLFLLLLLLLYIAYKLWQREQAKKRRLELARIEQQARESVLASDESFR
jgi:preprotein translocase subunit SecG